MPSFWQFVLLLLIAAGAGISVLVIKSVYTIQRPGRKNSLPAIFNKSVAKKETSVMLGKDDEPKQPPIKIIREQYFFSYKNLRIAEVEHRLDIYRPKESKFFAYYSEDYRSRFMAKSHDGVGLQIIPVWELPSILNEDTSSEEEKVTIEDTVDELATILSIAKEEVYKVVAIILLPEYDDKRKGYYEEIIVSWLDKREPEIKEKKERVDKITVATGGKASSYVDIQLAEKYEFESSSLPETINDKKLDENEDYTTILDDKRHYIFRFRRGLSGKVVNKFKIGLEKMLWTWIRLGAIIGIGTIAFSIMASLYAEPFIHVSPIILGALAVLVGFRILLFEDIDLLEKWSWIYIILIIVNSAVLVYIGVNQMIFQESKVISTRFM